jgi:hypothetical protein
MSNDVWRPSKRQLETLADCVAARLDTAQTAALLGVDETMFLAWTKRLAAGAAWEQQHASALLAAPVKIATRAEQECWRRSVSISALRPI